MDDIGTDQTRSAAEPDLVSVDSATVPIAGHGSSDADLRRGMIRARLFPAAAPKPTVGRFELLDVLGQGGMGVVYKARDPQLDRFVAIKLLVDEDAPKEVRARLLREAKVLARLSHANVVQVYEAGLFDGRVFLAIEYIAGGTLSAWIQNSEGRDWAQTLDTLIAAGAGLAAAHVEGIVHRDFKPANVLLGEDGVPKVTDFGIARAPVGEVTSQGDSHPPLSLGEGGGLTSTGTVLGTPAYMSPEQICGDPLDASSDQFSFCVVLFEALTGQRPFKGKTVSELRAALLSPTPVEWGQGVQLPGRLRAAVDRGLASDPNLRWPNMDALLAELGALRDAPARRRRVLLSASAAALLAVGTWAATRAAQGPGCEPVQSAQALVMPPRLARIDKAFSATELPYAQASSASSRRGLEALAQQIDAAETQSCLATHDEGRQSEARLDERASCFGRQRDALNALVAELEQADANAVSRSVAAVASLGERADCADGTSALVLPADTSQAARVGVARAALQRARLAIRLGDWWASEAAIADAARGADGLVFQPLERERLMVDGDYAVARDRSGMAVQAYEQALAIAEAEGNDAAIIELLRRLLRTAHALQADPKRAAQWSERLSAVAQRAGQLARVQPELAQAQAEIAGLEGRYQDATKLSRAQLATQREQRDPPRVQAATAFRVAAWLYAAGQQREAVESFAQSAQLSLKELGEGHPDVLMARRARLAPMLELGDLQGVQAEIDALLAAYTRDPLGNRMEMVRTLGIQSKLAAAQGDLKGMHDAATTGIDAAKAVEDIDAALVAELHTGRGTASFFLGQTGEAVTDYRAALGLLELNRPGSEQELTARANLAEALNADGKVAQALAQFELVQQGRRKFPQMSPADVAVGERAHAQALQANGDTELARAKYQRAIELFASAQGETMSDEIAATRELLTTLGPKP